MQTAIRKFSDFFERWVRHRYALPLALVLGAGVLVASEIAYRDTVSTVRGGIALTDARIQALRLLQLVTDAESAELAYLVSGAPEELARSAEVKAETAIVLRAVAAYFFSQGAAGAAAAQRVAAATERAFTRFERTLALAQAGKPAEAAAMAGDAQGRADLQLLRTEMSAHLARATAEQQQARHSIYEALQVGRLAVGSLTLGTLLLLFLFVRQLGRYDSERRARQGALLDERKRLEVEVQQRTARLTELARHLQTAIEDERARLARELHDELGGLLTASKLDIARARNKAGNPGDVLASLERINVHLTNGIALKRRIIEDLRPSALADLGLTAALDSLCQQMSASLAIPVQLSAAEFKLSAEAELVVYRFVQEALTNIGKYASASRVEVNLAVVGSSATVEVHDDGVGFVPQDSYAGHHGLSGMQFRAESIGGTMRVSSQPGHGTRVSIEFPQDTL